MRHPMSGVGGCLRFVTIRFGNVLAMWAATRIVWTEPYRKPVTSTPFRTLLSEPLCVITDDMTYLEIEALSGTMYDYDDVNDNTPVYFDYDDPRHYEEWVAGMIQGMMECIMIPTDRMLLMMRLLSPGLGWVFSRMVL